MKWHVAPTEIHSKRFIIPHIWICSGHSWYRGWKSLSIEIMSPGQSWGHLQATVERGLQCKPLDQVRSFDDRLFCLSLLNPLPIFQFIDNYEIKVVQLLESILILPSLSIGMGYSTISLGNNDMLQFYTRFISGNHSWILDVLYSVCPCGSITAWAVRSMDENCERCLSDTECTTYRC